MTVSAGCGEALAGAARDHLPGDIADVWISLLRPGIRLRHAEEGDQMAGHLGGQPSLPPGVPWPEWEEQGPLAFVACLDCAHLAGVGGLPADGVLSFFYFDGQIDDGDTIVGPWDPGTQAGARVLYVPAGVETSPREAPTGIEPYPRVPLRADLVVTAPPPTHPVVLAAFQADFGTIADHPVSARAFRQALPSSGDIGHRVAGYAAPVQNDVEYEIATTVLGDVEWHDPALQEEAAGWVLLAQFDTDDRAGMMWGDVGALYWLIRLDDLAARRFDRAVFTWQCC
ncbi:hypothetical protein Pth03_40410 [Planotetraspora thailandica]|uniref:DUF1963 domain-containing protein n=1 Tax=Planotetraspora thailandica TaxID=487172 RepID=A0A8J3V1N3_9ACTN|nr:YwqG family protein [Planotetraspora thailandica]GII55652.1 hypothetical protein Pth03_40410 [Planotetraspora thailandica]